MKVNKTANTSNLALDVGWQPLDPSDSLPVGAYVQEQIIGTAGAVTNGVLGTVTMTKTGTTNYSISVDYTPIGGPPCTVQAYRNGVLVAQATNQNGASLASCNIWGDSGCIPRPPILGGGWDWTNDDVLATIAGGASVQCDHLYITPENVSGASTALQITASQVPSINMTAVTVSPLLVSCRFNWGTDTNLQHNVTLQWFGTGVLQQSSDLRSWTDLPSATSTYTTPAVSPKKFYRVRQ